MRAAEKNPVDLSVYDRFPQLKEIPKEGFPKHLLIIPDGNRRFAKSLGQTPIEGHRQGIDIILDLLRDMRELPINVVTFWALSSDNFNSRTPEEIQGLMQLMEIGIHTNLDELHVNNVRLIHLGRKDRISRTLYEAIVHAEELTNNNTGQTLCLAIDFSGEDQDVRVSQEIAQRVQAGKLLPQDITPQIICSLRDGRGLIPPADLLIRTSGERRTSGIGWLEGKETELYFTEKLFPQIKTDDIVNAIVDFARRQRRFGA